MADLASFSVDLEEICPEHGPVGLNSCPNPDCRAFGFGFRAVPKRLPRVGRKKTRCETAAAVQYFQLHRPGSYTLTGTDKENARVCRAFERKKDPLEWRDNRTMTCRAELLNGTICGTKFTILSEDHLNAEVDRLRNMNGVLNGPACGACGRRYLDAPEEFSMNGAHQRKTAGGGSAPKAIRVIHRPCKGCRGARFTISIPHARQKTTKDNIRILNALVNSAGINDVRRILGANGTGSKIGISRIYDRIAWFEQVFLAYEREMLKRWKKKKERSRKETVHRLSHDDLILSVNWEASSTRATTQLNCAVTADVDSGYVYRIDVDFDPTVSPIEFFRQSFLDEMGMPQNIAWSPARAGGSRMPLFAWQRPTGRYHEPHFFAACENELKAFMKRASRAMGKKDAQLQAILSRVEREIDTVRLIGQDWFGFKVDAEHTGGSFRGMTTRDIYTKAAHFVALKEMLPAGSIILTTEQEATLPRLLPHIFRDEIQQNRFVWLAMAFNKKAKKPEILRKVKDYRDQWQKFYNEGLYDKRFDLGQDPQEITKAFIAEKMKTAVRTGSKGDRPFPISNFEQAFMPSLWVQTPTQASGELDKTVGFPLVGTWLRNELRPLPFNTDVQTLDHEVKNEIAELVYNATLQPVSTFMNAVRERLGATVRAGGGARVGGSYVQGAMFNPRILISLLNIFRVHYNYFELRPYVAPHNEEKETKGRSSSHWAIRYPGTDELIPLRPLNKRTPQKKTPAMRHGIEAHVRDKCGALQVPNLYRTLYRPWLYAGTPVGKRFERSRRSQV
ncbi:hypothetical protein SAMN05444279_1661 [Ruegeria intermedia]|uniref:Uncharacterized protein n=1 Tax=Ruegeria intermedia TaxID=996115 RepID=A0A1M5C0I6_9RHOB|nr:hypothetical protein [Ruegeria intermedia]SHF48263.1 hypothetical protein SAMN05444279_1661 [Ruegeria intermedia]